MTGGFVRTVSGPRVKGQQGAAPGGCKVSLALGWGSRGGQMSQQQMGKRVVTETVTWTPGCRDIGTCFSFPRGIPAAPQTGASVQALRLPLAPQVWMCPGRSQDGASRSRKGRVDGAPGDGEEEEGECPFEQLPSLSILHTILRGRPHSIHLTQTVLEICGDDA